jgi:hypothetical protein
MVILSESEESQSRRDPFTSLAMIKWKLRVWPALELFQIL